MKTYKYSEAKQDYAMVLNTALMEDVLIRRKAAAANKQSNHSSFEVMGVNSDITSQEIIDFVRAGREK